MLNNPLYCEKQTWTVLNPARVHIYVRLELSVKIKTGGEGKTKTSTPFGFYPANIQRYFLSILTGFREDAELSLQFNPYVKYLESYN